MSDHRRYRGRKPGELFSRVCCTLSGAGFVLLLAAANLSDNGGPGGVCTVMAIAGLAAFAGFGRLGGLIW